MGLCSPSITRGRRGSVAQTGRHLDGARSSIEVWQSQSGVGEMTIPAHGQAGATELPICQSADPLGHCHPERSSAAGRWLAAARFFSRYSVLLLVLIALVRGLTWSTMVLPLYGYDEPQHFMYARDLFR